MVNEFFYFSCFFIARRRLYTDTFGFICFSFTKERSDRDRQIDGEEWRR